MTNPTPHGQVPEALRLAEQYDHGDPAAHGNAWKAAVCTELRRLHAENEALRTQQPAPDGAPPGAYVNGAGIKADDRPSTVIRKLNARFHDLVTFPRAEKFAASPTPPAEQQARPGAVYAELPEPDFGPGRYLGKATCEGSVCTQHAAVKCCVCGEQATHECDHTGQFVCGAPLCNNCEGHTDTSKPAGGWGFMNHTHRQKGQS